MLGRLRGLYAATRKARSTSRYAQSEASILLKGPWDGPEPLVAASFRLLTSHPIRVADGHILGHLGVPGCDDDIATGT